MISFDACMSKKRKTRKQKELAHERSLHQVHIQVERPIYSISSESSKKVPVLKTAIAEEKIHLDMNEVKYLKHDMRSIAAASGIVAAFDILLFVLLGSGVIHLNIFGY